MYHINFSRPIHVHFMGIGGISMSGLARILLNNGFTISGSDLKPTPLTEELSAMGATIYYGQVASNLEQRPDLLVYTAAISSDNEEYAAAKAADIPMLSRAELLGQIMANYPLSIGVAGTHGKTTTTGMVANILLAGHTDPTISVGGILPAIHGNIRIGGGDIFLTEACEYTDSFLHFYPTIGIILNIDEDHLDYFSGIDQILDSFHKYASNIPSDGALIIKSDIDGIERVVDGLKCSVIKIGIDGYGDSDYSAKNLNYNEQGHGSFSITRHGQELGTIQLSVPGEHNVYNALCAYACADRCGLSHNDIANGLARFGGTLRRFEHKGIVDGVTIIDDYAHHPTEIAATLKASKNIPHRDLWVVFQPHTYTRTKALFNEFATVLSTVDHLVLVDIYAAREKNTIGISSQDLAAEIAKSNCDVTYCDSFESAIDLLQSKTQPEDLLITMGAGNVVEIGERMLDA